MRGKEFLKKKCLPRSGITPAYAGKSQAGSLSHKRIEDHPRLCGEKGLADETREYRTRITPAYAGKSAVAKR